MAREKKVKDKWLGARVDVVMEGKVSAYIEAADISMGDLIRRSVNEYMVNHPQKQESSNQTQLIKPGE